jgi:methylase of polypeptide subunit release factors
MFGWAAGDQPDGVHGVLMDGARSSFALSKSTNPGFVEDDAPLSWYWSARLRHALIVDPSREVMFLRRWDMPAFIRKFRIPLNPQGALEMLRQIETAASPQAPDVILHVMHAFRLIRQALGADDSLQAIRALNGLLLLAHAAHQRRVVPDDALHSRTFGEAFQHLDDAERDLAQVEKLPSSLAGRPLGEILRHFLDPERSSGRRLVPDLLFRHAASSLYQEAHLQIERDPQTYLPGLGPLQRPRGQLPRDVRFTPSNLARALVQQALAALDMTQFARRALAVLDPACGSGIFLQESLRELAQLGFRGQVSLTGYDITPVSVSIANFCLQLASKDTSPAGVTANVAVAKADALETVWGQPDVVLMNPPFISWERMTPAQREAVRSVLGTASRGRPDMAEAFVLKAVRSVAPGGVVATVIPAPLLSGESARPWREAITDRASLRLVGRFEGYKYFPTSLVQTAFVVLQTKHGTRAASPPPVKAVIAEEGAEDASLRLLRRPSALPSEQARPSVDIFDVPADKLPPTTWLAPRRETTEFLATLDALALPTVSDLFIIRQGVRTGDRKAFVIPREDLRALPAKERRFFRPAAGQGTIVAGRLEPTLYVFYPYDTAGLTLNAEQDLIDKVPTYYSRFLQPRRSHLARRRGVAQWWSLTRPRTWQFSPAPKIISTYFGASGSFAYDHRGQYVVVDGFAWLWRRGPSPNKAPSPNTGLALGYIALLNSPLFERILACFCPRLQGGQMRLEHRFLRCAPLPDLSNTDRVPVDVVQKLALLGRSANRRRLASIRQELERASAQAYGFAHRQQPHDPTQHPTQRY